MYFNAKKYITKQTETLDLCQIMQWLAMKQEGIIF